MGLSVVLSVPGVLQAQELPQEGVAVTVQGRGAIIAGDRAKAEEDALNDALRNAVERVLGTHISSQTLTENFMLVRDRIYTQANGYISSYDVINTSEEPDMITVTVSAVVKESQLVEDLQAIGILMARKDFPRLLLLIDEQIFLDEGGEQRVPTTVDNAATTTAFMEILQPKGFRFVDPTTVALNTEVNVLSSALSGDLAEAVKIGRAYQAEVIVLGKTVAKLGEIRLQGAEIRAMRFMQVSISARAIRADTGEIIATSQETAGGMGTSPVDGAHRGIQAAMSNLAPRLEEIILERWSQDVTSATVVELHIVNQVSFGDVQRFQQLLSYYVRGVEGVILKNFTEGLTILEVTCEGGAMDLATQLSTKTWEDFRIEVTGLTANQVKVRINPKGIP